MFDAKLSGLQLRGNATPPGGPSVDLDPRDPSRTRLERLVSDATPIDVCSSAIKAEGEMRWECQSLILARAAVSHGTQDAG